MTADFPCTVPRSMHFCGTPRSIHPPPINALQRWTTSIGCVCHFQCPNKDNEAWLSLFTLFQRETRVSVVESGPRGWLGLGLHSNGQFGGEFTER